MSADQDRRRNRATSESLKRLAAQRQCPQCKRKAALSKTWDGDYVERRCRYCGWAQGRYVV